MLSLAMKLGLAGPLAFMLPHHVAPPTPHAVAVVVPAPAPITPEATTTTTTLPPTPVTNTTVPVAPVTTTQTDCVVTYYFAATDVTTGMPYTATDSYEGDCGTAASIAAAHPGATVTQHTFPITTSPGGLG